MPFAPTSIFAPSSEARSPLVASLLLVAMPFAPSSFLAPSSKARTPSSVLARSSDALCS